MPVRRIISRLQSKLSHKPSTGELRVEALSDKATLLEHYLWQIGFEEGRAGIPPSEDRVVPYLHSIIAAHFEARSQEQQNNLTLADQEKDIISNRLKTITQKRNSAVEAISDLYETRSQNPSHFSFPVMLVYLLAAFFLFLSDIPLSFLLAEGLGIATITKSGGTEIADILIEPWIVFSELWETIFLGFGIMSLGIYIKYFVEENIFNWSHTWRERRASFLLNFLILTFLAVGIFTFGILRAQINAKLNSTQSEAVLFGLSLESWAFIIVSTLIPVTGGVLFATALERFGKISSLRSRQWTLNRIDSSISHLERARAKAARNQALASKNHELLKQRQESILGAAAAVYMSGFEQGKAEASLEFSQLNLLDQCKRLALRPRHNVDIKP